MWLKGIRVENIKCFEDTGEIFFTRNQTKTSTRPHRWITLLGENAVGKSTLLQAMGLLLSGPEAAKELMPRPEGWVYNLKKPGKLTAHICQEEGDVGKYKGELRERNSFSYSFFVTGNQPVKVSLPNRKHITEETYTEPALIEQASTMLSWLRTNAFASGSSGWFAAGYGAFRRLTREHRILIPSLSAPTRASNFATQFNDDVPISSFEQWMIYLDFRIAKDIKDDIAKKMMVIGTKVVTDLLPTNVRIQGVTKDGFILFELNGQPVPTVSMSDGYRSIIALAGDLIWRLLQTFPDMDDPTQASGVVLIDELDIHLHPVWQRQIATLFQKTFPKLQFIVATHSPLAAIGAGENALTLRLTKNDQGKVKIESVEDIFAYDVDRVLTSPAFGLVSTYSPETQEKIDKYIQLTLNFSNLKPNDKKLHAELKQFMQKAQPVNGIPEPGSLLDRMNKFLEENLP